MLRRMSRKEELNGWKWWRRRHGMTKIEEYKTLTELCLNETVFEYDGEIYEQNEGLAMGNPFTLIQEFF